MMAGGLFFSLLSMKVASANDESRKATVHASIGSGIYYTGYRLNLGAELLCNQWFAQVGGSALVSDGAYGVNWPIGLHSKAGREVLRGEQWRATMGVHYYLTPVKSSLSKPHWIHEAYVEQGMYFKWNDKVQSGLILGYGLFGEQIQQPGSSSMLYGTAANLNIRCVYTF